MSKSTKTRSKKVVLKIQGLPALRKIAKAASVQSDNVRTQFCLDMAASVAASNDKLTAKQYRAAKAAITKTLNTDPAIKECAVLIFGKADTWRRYANMTGFAAIAMLRYPKRTFTALQTSRAASLNSVAASNVGQLLIDADGKKDARGKNSKGKAAKTRTPSGPGKAAKVSDPASADHNPASDGKVITMRRFGQALTGHCTELGSMAALMADDNPDPDAVFKLVRKLLKSGASVAKEFDRTRLNLSIETGSNTKYASLI